MDAEAGATLTVVTTGVGGGAAVTVIVDVPDLPEVVAVIVAVPLATPLTTPLELTVATDALLVDHDNVCPVMTLPCASRTVADKETVDPATTEAVAGDTATVVTTGVGGGVVVTVIADVPTFPAQVAVIVADPAATPVTTPLVLTVAAAELSLDQLTL